MSARRKNYSDLVVITTEEGSFEGTPVPVDSDECTIALKLVDGEIRRIPWKTVVLNGFLSPAPKVPA